MAAAVDGNVRKLEELLNQAAIAKHINITDDGLRCSDHTILHDVVAALSGDLGCYLECKQAYKMRSEQGLLLQRTALVLAIEGSHTEAVSMLIKAGADVNQSVSEDDSPLHVAIRLSHHAVAMLLIQHESIATNAKVRACITFSHL